MTRIRIDPIASALAAELARIAGTVSLMDLVTLRDGPNARQIRGGHYYAINDSFPAPPLRAHLREHEDDCADCVEFRGWRLAYEQRCRADGIEPLPIMVAPATLIREQRAAMPGWGAPASSWLSIVGAMIEAGRSPRRTAGA